MSLRVVDLFSGCGGLSLGLKNAGFDVVAAYDSWDVAVKCYNANFTHAAQAMDLTKPRPCAQAIDALNPDIIAGGPPCQDFSHAGKRLEGERASLTSSFASIVQLVRPAWFIMENVDRARGSKSYALARRTFKSAGYGLTERTLNACFCGVPQARKRFFCIGGLGSRDDSLGALLDGRIRSAPMTVRQYLKSDISVQFYYRHPRNYSRRAIYSVDEPAPTMRGMNRPVPKGYPGHPGDAAPITSELRPLSTLERARIQTFPKTFRWIGTKTEVEQMIGNAVPVELASYVGKALFDYVNGNTRDDEEVQSSTIRDKDQYLWPLNQA